MSLSLLGPNGENKDVHEAVFGSKYPNARSDLRSAYHVEVHSLPSSYCIPDCMRGRDPTMF